MFMFTEKITSKVYLIIAGFNKKHKKNTSDKWKLMSKSKFDFETEAPSKSRSLILKSKLNFEIKT